MRTAGGGRLEGRGGKLRARLTGGDRRSIGRANAVAALASGNAQALAELVGLIDDANLVVAMRAADALEKASAEDPALLASFKLDLLDALAASTQSEVLWHVMQMLPRLPLTQSEIKAVIAKLRLFLRARSRIVTVCAMTAIQCFVVRDPALYPEWVEDLRRLSRSGAKSIAARARRLLAELAVNEGQ